MEKLIDLYEDEGFLLFFLACVLVIALIFGIYCLQGWIFYLLWGWLAIGYFSAPPLGYWACVGIVFALHFLGRIIFGRSSNNKD